MPDQSRAGRRRDEEREAKETETLPPLAAKGPRRPEFFDRPEEAPRVVDQGKSRSALLEDETMRAKVYLVSAPPPLR